MLRGTTEMGDSELHLVAKLFPPCFVPNKIFIVQKEKLRIYWSFGIVVHGCLGIVKMSVVLF